MFGHIFISTDSATLRLEEFARELFSRLGVSRFEERESSNYVEGHYFRGAAVGIDMKIAYADEQGLQDYRFWISMQPEAPGIADGGYLHQHAHTLAQLLSGHGWRCFVPDDFTTVSGDHEGKIYAA